MAKAIRDIDRGWGRIMRGLAELKGKEIGVGVQAGDKTKDGKMDLAELAVIHDFGATIHVAARRQTVFHKISKKGKFLRQGRFSKASRSNFARDVDVGAHTINIPSRPFMRDTFDEKSEAWKLKAQGQVNRIIDGRAAAPDVLESLGQTVQRDIQRKIYDGPFVPNAPSTVRRKKSARPLIDTGRMRQSVRYTIRKRGAGRLK